MIRRYKDAIATASRRPLYIGYALLGLAIVGLTLYLRSAEVPWEDGVEARIAAGKNVKVEHHIVSGLWYGSWINLALSILLVIALPFLTQPLLRYERKAAGISRRSRPVFWIAAAAALGVAVAICVPRLDKSLWGDEEYTLRRSVIGEYERNAEDIPTFRPLSWSETMWSYKKPNNHILNSVLTRASHEAFHHPTTEASAFHFDEVILRLPAFLAALGAVVAIGYALACLGFVRAGILSMFLLAIHPWFIRYGTETRGYAFVLLLTPLAFCFLIKAVRRGRWRYWIAYCLSEFFLFLAYPGTFYLLVATNLSALLLTLNARGGWQNRWKLTGRMVTANIVAAMLVIQSMAPCYAQLKAYLKKSEGENISDLAWLGDNLSYILTGLPWRVWGEDNPLCHTLAQQPVLGGVLLTLAAVALIAGVIRLYATSIQGRILLCYFLLQWPLLIGLSISRPDPPKRWILSVLRYRTFSTGSALLSAGRRADICSDGARAMNVW